MRSGSACTLFAIILMHCPSGYGKAIINDRERLRSEATQRLKAVQDSFEHIQGKSLFRVMIDYDKAKQQQKERGEDISKVTRQGQLVIELRNVSFAV